MCLLISENDMFFFNSMWFLHAFLIELIKKKMCASHMFKKHISAFRD
jgi:hypothetical protein